MCYLGINTYSFKYNDQFMLLITKAKIVYCNQNALFS